MNPANLTTNPANLSGFFKAPTLVNSNFPPTRSGPKIPAAGYLEEERFLDVNNLSFGLLALKRKSQWMLGHCNFRTS